MNICLVSAAYFPYTSGVTIHVQNLALHLRELGHSVEILTTSYPRLGGKKEDQVTRLGRVLFLPSKGSYFTLPFGFDLPLRVRDFLQKRNFDIVHVHGFAPPELAFWAIRYSNSVNVATFHTINIPNSVLLANFYRWFFKKHNQKIDGKIAVSKSTQNVLLPYFSGPFWIVSNGIDTTKFNPSVKPIYEINDFHHQILYVGRLEKRKGLSILLRALPLVKQKIPDATLMVVGHGPEENYYHQLVRDLRIKNSVKFFGFVQNVDLPKYYASCDLYCVPTPAPEATSIVILEAMAAGKPIVASDLSGYRELIGNNENGLLFEVNNPDDLALKIIKLFQSDTLRTKLVKSALKTVVEYDWRNVTKKVERIYQELLNKR